MWNEISYESKITKVTIPDLINLEKGIVPIQNPMLSKDIDGYYLLLVNNSDEKISVEKQDLRKKLFELYTLLQFNSLQYLLNCHSRPALRDYRESKIEQIPALSMRE